MPTPRGQRCLRRRRPDSSEDVENRRAQVTRKVLGLVESSLPLFPPVQWDRDDEIGSAEQVSSGVSHQVRQRPAQRTPTVVFEGVDDRSQCVLIWADTQEGQP